MPVHAPPAIVAPATPPPDQCGSYPASPAPPQIPTVSINMNVAITQITGDELLPNVKVSFACVATNLTNPVLVSPQGDVEFGKNASLTTAVIFNIVATGPTGVTPDYFQFFPLPFETTKNITHPTVPMYSGNDTSFNFGGVVTGAAPAATFSYTIPATRDYRIYKILFYHKEHVYSVDPKISNGGGSNLALWSLP